MLKSSLQPAVLALDTSTEQMSIAVQRGAQVWTWEGPGGAQSSAHLIPAIEGLMAQAQLRYTDLACIAFGQGPGSFTGLRTACSVAQGLGFAAGVPLLPVDSLMATAQAALPAHDATRVALTPWRVLALLDARMDEVYAAAFTCTPGIDGHGVWHADAEAVLCKPEALALEFTSPVDAICGNALAAYGARLPWPELPRWPSLPTAQAMLSLVPALLAQGLAVPAEAAMPRYIRNKVAQTTAEREALKRPQGA